MAPGFRRACRVLLLVAFFACCLSSSGWTQRDAPYMVLAVQLASDDPPEAIVNDGRREALLSRPDRPVDYFREFLTIEGVRREDAFLALRDSIRHKYQGRRIDVVIAHSTAVREFALRYREELFPNAPIVFSGIDVPDAATRSAGAGITGIEAGTCFRENLQLALRLHPSTRRVYVLAPTFGDYHDHLHAAIGGFSERVELIYLDAPSLSQLLATLRGLPADGLLLYVLFNVQTATNRLSVDQVDEAISEAAPIPVYATLDLQVGTGAVGGAVRKARETGLQEGAIAMRILDGERAQDIPIEPMACGPVFDWRQLQRWRIDVSQLPAGSQIKFRIPTAWEQHRRLILATLAVLLLQTVMIVGLIVQRARRRAMEQALKGSQERYALATAAASVGVWEWNLETDRVDVDPGLLALLGYGAGDIRGDREGWLELVHPEDRPTVRARAREVLEGRRSVYESEQRMLHRDGSIRWFLVRGSLVREQHRAARMVGINTDITERKHAEHELHELQREFARAQRLSALGEFAASIAHEVRQPLTAIITSARASLRFLGLGATEEAREALSYVLDAGKRADAVIERNRELFRSQTVVKEPLDLNRLILEAVAIARPRLQSGRVSLATALADGLPPVDGDRIQLQQVILNLVGNAVDAMAAIEPAARRLEISTVLDTFGTARVSVRDHGVGLGAVDMKRLFTLSYTTKPTGTGVGLSISRSIVEAHGGELKAEPNAKGGATFSFTLPTAAEPAASREPVAR